MGSDRPTYREVVDHVGHDRVRISLALAIRARGGEAEVVEGDRRQRVMPIAVFFLEAPRAPLIAAARADIEAAVEIRCHVSTGGGKAATGGPGERGARYVARVTCQAGPAALGPDIPSARRPGRENAPRIIHLRMRLNAPERHGKRDSGA